MYRNCCEHPEVEAMLCGGYGDCEELSDEYLCPGCEKPLYAGDEVYEFERDSGGGIKEALYCVECFIEFVTDYAASNPNEMAELLGLKFMDARERPSY